MEEYDILRKKNHLYWLKAIKLEKAAKNEKAGNLNSSSMFFM